MSKRVWISLFIALALIVFPAVNLANAKAPNLQQGANVYFSEWDESGCIETYIMLDFFYQEWKHPTLYELTHTSILAGKRDVCEDRQLLSGFILGNSPGTSFQIDSSLKNASVQVDSLMYDLFSNQMVEIKADLHWSGYGSRRQEVRNDKYQSGGCLYIDKTKEAARSATISGSVILDGQQIQNLGRPAWIYETSEKNMIVDCP